MIILVTIIVSASGTFYLSAYSESDQSMMTHNMGGMMDIKKSTKVQTVGTHGT